MMSGRRLNLRCCSCSGLALFVGIILFYSLAQVVRMGCDFWLAKWGDDTGHAQSVQFWSVGTALWVIATVIVAVGRSWHFTAVSVRASRALHERLFRRLMRAPAPGFFDVTPIGVITNRFSKVGHPFPSASLAAPRLLLSYFATCRRCCWSQDLLQVDAFLPDYLANLLQNGINLVGSVAVAVAGAPWFLLLLPPIGWMFVSVLPLCSIRCFFQALRRLILVAVAGSCKTSTGSRRANCNALREPRGSFVVEANVLVLTCVPVLAGRPSFRRLRRR